MTIWLNVHLSPALAVWITATFGITAIAVRDLALRESREIYGFIQTICLYIDLNSSNHL